MKLLILPISGPKFVNQIAAILHLSEINFVPDVTFSSSGGNVTAYLCSAANWQRHKILKLCYTLNSGLFVKKWCYSDGIAFIIGFFRGTVYNKGEGAKKWLEEMFDQETIQKDEIWTGTYNKKLQKPCLFTNKNKSNFIEGECFYTGINQCMPLCYTSGDIDLLSKSIMASACIPGVVPEQYIDGEPYSDGGVYSASPIVLLSEPFLKYFHKKEKEGEKLNLIYISPSSSYDSNCNEYINMLDNMKQASDNFVKSNAILDKVMAYNMITKKNRIIMESEFLCTLGNMQRVNKLWEIVDRSMLEIYPTEVISVSLSNFSGEDVYETVNYSYNCLKCKFWWLVPKNGIITEIEEIIKKCVDFPEDSHECFSV